MMFDPRPTKYPMPVQDPGKRCSNFSEVALGYSQEDALHEANRCLQCKNKPCISGCPVGVPIPDFIARLKEGDTEGAYRMIGSASSLPAVCGRVCPQERQCEKFCTRAIKGEAVAIGRLERYVADACASLPTPAAMQKNGHKVAVVGSGPAGLACAGELCTRGYRVTVFEALHLEGGVLVYGIPEFRLPKEIVRREIDRLKARGVIFETDCVVGRTVEISELMEEIGFEAVFLGTGAGLPRFMHIKGENARGVFSANEYLTRVNLMKAYEEDSETPVFRAKKAVVVGGGNVAMDAARCAVRLGAEVHIVYRRGEEELPARREETEHAKEEGVVFEFFTDPVEVLTDAENNVTGLRCEKTELGEPDASGRRSPHKIEGSEFTIRTDCVIMALGTSPNPLLKRTSGLVFGPHGEIAADKDGRTSLEGVFAGGDAVTGSATVILAMGAGKRAAASIDEFLRQKGGTR